MCRRKKNLSAQTSTARLPWAVWWATRAGIGIAIGSLIMPVTAPPVSASSGRAINRTPHATTSTQSSLYGVSCATLTACTAVGSYQKNFGAPFSMAERWTGTRWSLLPNPNPTGTSESSFNDVSCIAATMCTAVGFIGLGRTLAEQWNGTSWTIQPTPTPAGVTESILQGVSCTSATACVAVGVSYANGSTPPLAERWNGTRWILQSVPSPAGATFSELQRVSCMSAKACIAAGDFGDSAGNYFTLAERWDGAKWTIQRTPNPGGAALSFLFGISCTSTTSCAATGHSTNSAGSDATLAERWNGTSWAIEPTPNHTGTRLNDLFGISCTSATACFAVGDFGDTGNYFTLAERWNGTRWAIQPTPMPGLVSSLFGVSCTSASSCTGVQSYSRDLSTFLTLAERWNGTSWSVEPTPNPTG